MPRSVRFSEDTDAALVAKAAELDRSVSWVVQRAVERYLGPDGPAPSSAEFDAVLKGRAVPSPRKAVAGLEDALPAGGVFCPRCDWTGVDGASCPEHHRAKQVPR